MDWSDIWDIFESPAQTIRTFFIILGILACWAAVFFIAGWLGWCLGIAAFVLITISGIWLDNRSGK